MVSVSGNICTAKTVCPFASSLTMRLGFRGTEGVSCCNRERLFKTALRVPLLKDKVLLAVSMMALFGVSQFMPKMASYWLPKSETTNFVVSRIGGMSTTKRTLPKSLSGASPTNKVVSYVGVKGMR